MSPRGLGRRRGLNPRAGPPTAGPSPLSHPRHRVRRFRLLGERGGPRAARERRLPDFNRAARPPHGERARLQPPAPCIRAGANTRRRRSRRWE
ncbi:hypothetical protein NDU88_001904 [Pleurodeles waltl]|uniref:Uncharacterized protein n=1 Tax=Pleurodeles waltl TaxID=8319 RepID=A0AAV7TLI6_PLEWA|nr:hypothetical protein NDU88_001904 [Pleurodeles waltl]